VAAYGAAASSLACAAWVSRRNTCPSRPTPPTHTQTERQTGTCTCIHTTISPSPRPLASVRPHTASAPCASRAWAMAPMVLTAATPLVFGSTALTDRPGVRAAHTHTHTYTQQGSEQTTRHNRATVLRACAGAGEMGTVRVHMSARERAVPSGSCRWRATSAPRSMYWENLDPSEYPSSVACCPRQSIRSHDD
jgi:hypothetical protein